MRLLIVTQKVDKDDQLLGFFIDWIKEFSRRFEKVTIICLEKKSFDLPENVEVKSLGKEKGLPKLIQLSKFYFLTAIGRYDAVLVHMNPIWVILGGLLWKIRRKKIFLWYTHKAVTPKLRLAEKMADVIFTASKESFRLSSRKIIITGHGIDTGLFRPSDNQKLLKEKKIKILSVGRIAPVKNYETLIDAGKVLRDRGVDFSVTIAGEAPLERDKEYEKSLKFKIKNLKLEEYFKFLGKISHKDLPEYYRAYDVFVHLSRTGSVDKTLLEAMASGMKVLSSNDSAKTFLPTDLIFGENEARELADSIIAINKKDADRSLRDYVVRNHNLVGLIEKLSSIIKKAKVLYFGIYDPKYARNWVLINGLRKNGVEVSECRIAPGRFALLKLALKYLLTKKKDFRALIVGFPGQEVMILARFLTRKPIIFDAFTSHYGGYILDRKKWSEKSFRAMYFRFLDKWSCKLANVVLLDTQSHVDFFVKEFGLAKDKFRKIWIGANDDNFKPSPVSNLEDAKFRVIFFGTYVPLQGAEYIVRAAEILKQDKDVIFEFIGKGQDKPKCIKLAGELELKNIEFIDMMKPEDLRLKIANADIVLGLFGDTPKTPIVIPNKIYEALAMQKPVITADTPAIRELFNDEELMLVKAAKANEIAEGIVKLKNDSGLRQRIAENGHKKFVTSASTLVLGNELKDLINSCLKN